MANPTIYVDLIYTPKPDDYTGPRWQPWRISIKSGDNNEALFRSTEAWTNRADAIHAAQIAFGEQSNVYLREAGHNVEQIREASQDTPEWFY